MLCVESVQTSVHNHTSLRIHLTYSPFDATLRCRKAKLDPWLIGAGVTYRF